MTKAIHPIDRIIEYEKLLEFNYEEKDDEKLDHHQFFPIFEFTQKEIETYGQEWSNYHQRPLHFAMLILELDDHYVDKEEDRWSSYFLDETSEEKLNELRKMPSSHFYYTLFFYNHEKYSEELDPFQFDASCDASTVELDYNSPTVLSCIRKLKKAKKEMKTLTVEEVNKREIKHLNKLCDEWNEEDIMDKNGVHLFVFKVASKNHFHTELFKILPRYANETIGANGEFVHFLASERQLQQVLEQVKEIDEITSFEQVYPRENEQIEQDENLEYIDYIGQQLLRMPLTEEDWAWQQHEARRIEEREPLRWLRHNIVGTIEEALKQQQNYDYGMRNSWITDEKFDQLRKDHIQQIYAMFANMTDEQMQLIRILKKPHIVAYVQKKNNERILEAKQHLNPLRWKEDFHSSYEEVMQGANAWLNNKTDLAIFEEYIAIINAQFEVYDPTRMLQQFHVETLPREILHSSLTLSKQVFYDYNNGFSISGFDHLRRSKLVFTATLEQGKQIIERIKQLEGVEEVIVHWPPLEEGE